MFDTKLAPECVACNTIMKLVNKKWICANCGATEDE